MNTFRVKNFERFQHYKDRAPPWIKLYNELLENYEFGRLADAQKGQLISIWLLASRTDNQLPYDPIWIASKINATSPVDLDAMLASGFIVNGDTETTEHSEQVATPAQQRAKANGFGSRHIPDDVKRIVWQRDSGSCQECGATDDLEYDHKHPVSKGGSSEAGNIQLLCRPCNRRKRVRVATPAQPMRSLEGEGQVQDITKTEQIAVADAPRARAVERKSRKGNATALPDGYCLPEKIAAYGAEQGLSKSEVTREHQRFCNHAKQNDRRCVDWEAAERNWLLGSAEKLGRSPPAASSSGAEDGMIEVLGEEELAAWDRYGQEKRGKSFPRNTRGGWRFPSRWPPGYVPPSSSVDPLPAPALRTMQ